MCYVHKKFNIVNMRYTLRMNIPFDVQSNMEATQCIMCIDVRTSLFLVYWKTRSRQWFDLYMLLWIGIRNIYIGNICGNLFYQFELWCNTIYMAMMYFPMHFLDSLLVIYNAGISYKWKWQTLMNSSWVKEKPKFEIACYIYKVNETLHNLLTQNMYFTDLYILLLLIYIWVISYLITMKFLVKSCLVN